MTSFDELVAEASAAPFTGWDFGWLRARCTAGQRLPWSYPAEVAARAAAARAMLDMGTGGGERLARVRPRPERTIATESWQPNVALAASRLRPLGIPVIQCDGAPENMSAEGLSDQPGRPGLLPFRDSALDLVINRHESFRGDEVARVLAPGGTFISQQVDYHSYDDLYRLLGLDLPAQPDSWLPVAAGQLTSAGLNVTTAQTGQEITYFDHVGAVIYYLRVVGWAVPEYSLEAFLPRLRDVSAARDRWPLQVTVRRLLVIAEQPASARTKEAADGR